jgi:hypothetical protein
MLSPLLRKSASAMSSRPAAPSGELNLKQRLCLFHNTSMSAEEALALEDEQLTGALLVEKGVKVSNIAAAGMGPVALHGMGVHDAQTLRAMGFTALYLADAVFASEANSAYGGPSVIEAFLVSASDAVCIAGSDAVGILGVTTQQLMEACACAPTEAAAVLQQTPGGNALQGVSPTTLLDTGLRKPKLMELGYSLAAVVKQTGASHTELAKLGFGL